jgi:hypothetical protein
MLLRQLSLIFKVLIASAALSVGIKTLGPHLFIPATSGVALTLVLLPTLILGLVLGVQYRLQHR